MKTSSFKPHRNASRGSAFTLIEMLTVIGIIGLLIALATPALVDVVRSTRLNAAGDGLLNRLSLAQQSAISLGTEVELRFYRYNDDDSQNAGTPNFYAYQVVQVPFVGAVVQPKALSDPYYIESGVVLSQLAALSPLLQTTVPQTEAANDRFLFQPAVAGVDPGSIEYAALRFSPDGSCRALSGAAATTAEQAAIAYTIPPLSQSFVTFVDGRDVENAAPNNFYCIQIDSYTGKSRVYRP